MDLNQCPCSGKNLARLVRPALLALLGRGETHGYDLVTQLGRLSIYADGPPDTSGIYKVLKAMEREGLVVGRWELGDSGPAKRRYALTDDGRQCLRRWIATLEGYRLQIDGLLAVLTPNAGQGAGSP